MLARFNRNRNSTQQDQPDPPSLERVLQLQHDAQAWRELAEREEQVAQLLRTCLVEQREIVISWDISESDDALISEIAALEGACQGMVSRTVELIRQALLREQQGVKSARAQLAELKASKPE